MRIPVIGLSGPRRSGKDTIRRFIIAAQGGYGYSFADPLRAMLWAGFGIDMNDPYWEANKEVPIPALGVSPRDMMRTLGTEWGRQMVNEDVWLILAKDKLLSQGSGMVIADVRFENEAAWVRDIGGRIIHVSRPGAPTDVAHASDTPIKQEPGDGHIVNMGTLEELQSSVGQLLHV